MRAIQITEPKPLEQIDIDEPASPGPDEILVRTHRMGVCGTDISSYLGKFPFFEYPRIPGHELGDQVIPELLA
jgi:threonine dehydrogenase-like Zn-dependent dehydrogenase